MLPLFSTLTKRLCMKRKVNCLHWVQDWTISNFSLAQTTRKYDSTSFLKSLKSKIEKLHFSLAQTGSKNLKIIDKEILFWFTTKILRSGMRGTRWRNFNLGAENDIRLKYAYLAHYDGAINGKFEICQCLPDSGYHPLHAVDLLP